MISEHDREEGQGNRRLSFWMTAGPFEVGIVYVAEH
jgi:hypothetical protein